MLGVLAAATATLGFWNLTLLYWVPYWTFVVWLDAVTYLHHHGSDDADEKMPWCVPRDLIFGPGADGTSYN